MSKDKKAKPRHPPMEFDFSQQSKDKIRSVTQFGNAVITPFGRGGEPRPSRVINAVPPPKPLSACEGATRAVAASRQTDAVIQYLILFRTRESATVLSGVNNNRLSPE